MDKFFTYILYSEKSDRYYIGQTSDLPERIARHNAGYEKSTAPHRPYKLVWHREYSSRKEAVILEKKLKNLNRQKLLAFIEKYI